MDMFYNIIEIYNNEITDNDLNLIINKKLLNIILSMEDDIMCVKGEI